MTKTEIKHKEEIMQLNTLEAKLVDIISNTGDSELMETFNKWQEQRNVCNGVYNEWLTEVL